jgi:hypothetical protein
MNTSRFITYPSTVETNLNHKIIVIDATEQELGQLERFLQTSRENFDVYIYPSDNYDLEWLNYASTDAELILINNSSQVRVTPSGTRYQDNLLEYFERIELDLHA